MIPKFRAWDTHEEVMNRVDYIDFADGIVGLSNENVKDYEQPIHRVKFMQSTNLLDKDGVEIYEGDILHWTSEVVAREDWIGLVERINAEFNVWTSKRARSSGGWLNVANERVEVIGNQYEHHYLIPELLEEQNK